MTQDQQQKSLADLLGITLPETIAFGGKEYPLRGPTVEEQKRYAQWLESRALAKVEAQAPYLSAQSLKDNRSLWHSEAASGKYGFYSPTGIAAQAEPEGKARLYSIILTAEGHAECTPEYVEQMLWAEVEKGAYAIAEAAARGDPKALETLKRAMSLFMTIPTPATSTPDTETTASGA